MKLRPLSRVTAFGLFACLAIALMTFWAVRADARRQKRKIADAAAALKNLGAMEEYYRNVHGRYTPSVFPLANMTKDWKGFLDAMDVMLDLRAGFVMQADRTHYRIEARARDRKRTWVIQESPKAVEAQNAERILAAGIDGVSIKERLPDISRRNAGAVKALNGGTYTIAQKWSLRDIFSRVEAYNQGRTPAQQLVPDLSPGNLYWDARLKRFRLIKSGSPTSPGGAIDLRWVGDAGRANFEKTYGLRLGP